MSNQDQVRPIVDGPSKVMLSMALFYAEELSIPEVEFTFKREGGVGSESSRWSVDHDTGKVYENFRILSVERAGGSGVSFDIRARHKSHGRVKIYFRTDIREGSIEFLEIEE
jgi:hypothetical protein